MGKICWYVLFSLITTMASAKAVIQTDRGLLQVDSIVESNNETFHKQKRSLPTPFGPDSTYLANSGLTCYVCRPGFYRKSDCTSNGTTAVCEPCRNGTYSTTYNIAISCDYCSPQCIDKNAVVHSQCNSTADISCQCKNGYHYHSKGGGEWMCLPHSSCSAGTEVDIAGTFDQDTQCTPCSVGTFSPERSLDNCMPCNICGSNKIPKTKCNGITDTVCENKDDDDLTLKIVLLIVIVVAVVVGLVVVVVFLWRKEALQTLRNWLCSSSESEDAIEKWNPNAMKCNNNVQIIYSRNEGAQETACSTATETTIPAKTENYLWVQVFKKVSSEINIGEWKSVIRHLLGKYCSAASAESKIEEICYDNKYDGIKETIYQCLLAWSKLTDEAYLDDIISSLEAHDMLGLADDLNRNYASLLKAYHDEGECDPRDQE